MTNLKEILDKHLLWVNNQEWGEKADLSGANLGGANLRYADLQGAIGVFIFNKCNGRICYAVEYEKSLMIKADCFWGTLNEFEKACFEKYKNDVSKNYFLQIEYLQKLLLQIQL